MKANPVMAGATKLGEWIHSAMRSSKIRSAEKRIGDFALVEITDADDDVYKD